VILANKIGVLANRQKENPGTTRVPGLTIVEMGGIENPYSYISAHQFELYSPESSGSCSILIYPCLILVGGGQQILSKKKAPSSASEDGARFVISAAFFCLLRRFKSCCKEDLDVLPQRGAN
jgi:hypothetical protein